MDKEALHDHIADILERIAHLNKSLAGTHKILPVEVDLLKGYMAELDKSFEALIYKEVTDEKISVNNETENIEVEEAPKVETAPVVDEADLPTQTAIEEEVAEEPAVEDTEVGYHEPVEETPEGTTKTKEEVAFKEPIRPSVAEEEVFEQPEPVRSEPASKLLEEQEPEKNELIAETEPEPHHSEELAEEPEAEPEPAVEVNVVKERLYTEELDDDNEKVEEQPAAKGATSLNERFSKREGEELGYKIKAPMQSLKAMIDLSEKYVYTKELFGGDKDHFESTLKYLDQCTSLNEANEHIANVVRPRFKWDDKKDIEKRFKVLLEKRFN